MGSSMTMQMAPSHATTAHAAIDASTAIQGPNMRYKIPTRPPRAWITTMMKPMLKGNTMMKATDITFMSGPIYASGTQGG